MPIFLKPRLCATRRAVGVYMELDGSRTTAPVSANDGDAMRRCRMRHKDIVKHCWAIALICIGLLLQQSQSFRPPLSRNLKIQKYQQNQQSKQQRLVNAVNGVNGFDKSTNNNDDARISPYHLLYPQMIHEKLKEYQKKRALPLHSCLTLLEKAVNVIATMPTDSDPNLQVLPLLTKSGNQNMVIRIEHKISQIVDPLGWIHAQTKRHQLETADNFGFYIHSSIEAAAIGAAWKSENDDPVLTSRVGTSSPPDLWDFVATLPDSTYLYGAERFDSTLSTPNSKEWKDFGTKLWFLPSVEMRRRVGGDDGGGGDDDDSNSMVLAVHVCRPNPQMTWQEAAQATMRVLQRLTDAITDNNIPPTTLPPVLYRGSSYGGEHSDGQELYENGVMKAIQAFEQGSTSVQSPFSEATPIVNHNVNNGGAAKEHNGMSVNSTRVTNEKLEKVVLARRMDLHFDDAELSGLDVLRKWKYNGGNVHEGGHLFYMSPSPGKEFFGCTPERLFRIHRDKENSGTTAGGKNMMVVSEALAGTRRRGSTQKADEELTRDLFTSQKDRSENLITGRLIQDTFQKLEQNGFLDFENGNTSDDDGSSVSSPRFFVRRLRHLQHICQHFSGKLKDESKCVDVTRQLLTKLHPTPAVCGFPVDAARNFIRENESIGFDRGCYAGPLGYIGKDASDILVGLRSALISREGGELYRSGPKTKVSVYAGAGLVKGSTVQSEWAETTYKLDVISSLFPQSPITLQSAPTPNVAWATVFIEELIRNGVTQFYVCPGSRSTPLVVAIARAVRSNVGVVNAVSVHDERGAAFRAVGYGRGANRPAAIVTSSGTAIANLYPAIVEAGMDGIPMLVLTADRPYESRDTGANQAIDQVKAFSASYIRWFRDILPPSDDVPVSVALGDASQAVTLSRDLRGPVHLNIQFRENLAPDVGPIRNDDRSDSVVKFNNIRFVDVPGFARWSSSGNRWVKSYSTSHLPEQNLFSAAVVEIGRLLAESKRGIIVVGNLRTPTDENQMEDVTTIANVIGKFAESVGLPVIAGVQSGSLRFSSTAVIPYAEYLLRNPSVVKNLKPDFILQIGSPFINTEVPGLISQTMKGSKGPVYHVLLHPHHPSERADPNFTVSHKVSAEVSPFLKALLNYLDSNSMTESCSSMLSPLISLGRKVQENIHDIIDEVSKDITTSSFGYEYLTEPQIVKVMSQIISSDNRHMSLFLSNSMPVRDAELFLYPGAGSHNGGSNIQSSLKVGTNRGASGIDGIISSASGYAEATGVPTTLLIGDLATLHDINSFHALGGGMALKQPLTTIIINNDGGGIFSFLPIAQHGSDVSFESFFGTPTNTFSFKKGCEAYGLHVEQVSNSADFQSAYGKSCLSSKSNVIEAQVVGRDENVAVHKGITAKVNSLIDDYLDDGDATKTEERLPIKVFARDSIGTSANEEAKKEKTLVLLHGWMGDKTEWEEASTILVQSLPAEWSILAVDIPGHGETLCRRSSEHQSIRSTLGLDRQSQGSSEGIDRDMCIDQMARSLLTSLAKDYGVKEVDALAGYSLGGRVALAMKRISSLSSDDGTGVCAIKDDTKMILLSAYPGDLSCTDIHLPVDKDIQDSLRIEKDDKLADEIENICNRADLFPSSSDSEILWHDFLQRWYGASIWGNLKQSGVQYHDMIAKRCQTLSRQGRDLASVLRQCTPPRNTRDDWRVVSPDNTLFIAGSLDVKYSELGETWSNNGVNYLEVPDCGHALLIEAPSEIADAIGSFIVSKSATPEFGSFKSPMVKSCSSEISVNRREEQGIMADQNSGFVGSFSSLDFEPFSIEIYDERRKEEGVSGIGWAENAKVTKSNKISQRSGLIIQIVSQEGTEVGVGEVSPLSGLHTESLEEAEAQLNALKLYLDEESLQFDAGLTLACNGYAANFLDSLGKEMDNEGLLPSVRAGIEMALISLAAQVVGLPIHHALGYFGPQGSSQQVKDSLPLNGIITRGSAVTLDLTTVQKRNTYPSVKVKVGHQDMAEDVATISQALQRLQNGAMEYFRADANRAWDFESAVKFANMLEGLDIPAVNRLEFIEEPLEKEYKDDKWSLGSQVSALERLYKHTAIPYALDESIGDLAAAHNYEFRPMYEELRTVFLEGKRSGCAAFVLKPSLLGLELALQLARKARTELGIAAVFSSSFDSGVGLAYASFLGAVSDGTMAETSTFPHGIATFSMFAGDTLSPSFSSYVNDKGVVNVASLARAFYGLGLEEIRDSFVFAQLPIDSVSVSSPEVREDSVNGSGFDNYEVSTATSSSGREISVTVSLPLPFSAEIACARFTDLPQISRWAPWIRSVRYVNGGRETEWVINIRGVEFKWRALSSLLVTPNRGVRWASISGLKNRGVVEFVDTGENTSLMKLRMSILTPRILASLFRNTSVYVEDFLRDKLLKWSLEMFRDVVKGDLALERGDAELGDIIPAESNAKANDNCDSSSSEGNDDDDEDDASDAAVTNSFVSVAGARKRKNRN